VIKIKVPLYNAITPSQLLLLLLLLLLFRLRCRTRSNPHRQGCVHANLATPAPCPAATLPIIGPAGWNILPHSMQWGLPPPEPRPPEASSAARRRPDAFPFFFDKIEKRKWLVIFLFVFLSLTETRRVCSMLCFGSCYTASFKRISCARL
jgi:hypothetical protein